MPSQTQANANGSSVENKQNKENKAEIGFKQVNSNENMLNPNPWYRLIGPQNVASVEINGTDTLALVDTGCQVTNLSLDYCKEHNLPIHPIEHITDIYQADGTSLEYVGFTEINLKCKHMPKLNLDIPVLVVNSTDYHCHVPLTIGTLTLSQMVDNGSLENDIDLPTTWKYGYHGIHVMRELAKTPAKSLGKIRTTKTLRIPADSESEYACLHKVKGHGMDMHVMVEPKQEFSNGLYFPCTFHKLKVHESKIHVKIQNTSDQDIVIPKNKVIGDIFLGNAIPNIVGTDSVQKDPEQTIPKSIQADFGNPKFSVQNLKESLAQINKVNKMNNVGKNKSQLETEQNKTKPVETVSSLPTNVQSVNSSVKKGCVDQNKSDQTGTANKVSSENGIQSEQNKSDSTKRSNVNQEENDWVLEKLDLSGMAEWPAATQLLAKSLLREYADIFSKDDLDLGRTDLTKHKIELTDYTPFKQSYRRIPPHLYDQVKAHLEDMLKLKAIKKSYSPWSSSIVLVQKKDGTLRFCIDLRELNNRTIKDNYSLPRIEHHLEQLIGATWFTTLDLKSGYWQVELDEAAKPLTAFTVGPLGFYQCETMPFGAVNAPATFQRLMENCLGDLNLKWCVVYLDDIIIFAKTPEDHLSRLRAVFEKLRLAKLKLKPSKCNFFQREISYLGHKVSELGIATDPAKIEKVAQWPRPKTVNEVRSFLGFVGYYRKYIKGFSKIAKPLNQLLTGLETSSKKVAKKTPVSWGELEQNAFDQLKVACTSAPVLGYADFTKPFILHTDSSLDGLGAVLYQKDDSEKLRVIAYASRGLTKPEKNYPAHKLEFLALKWAVTDKFKEYLYGAQFEVYTDNNPLTYILTTARLDATTQRWVAALASFQFQIFYKSGKHNQDADGLSRIKWPEKTNDILINRQMCTKINLDSVNAILHGTRIPYGFSEILCLKSTTIPTAYTNTECGMNKDDWQKEQQSDPHLKFLIDKFKENKNSLRKLKKKELEHLCPGIGPFVRYIHQFQVHDELLYRKIYTAKGKNSYLLQLVLPQNLFQDALSGCHDEVGHLGRDKSLDLLKERFFWPSMNQDLKNHINSCRRCIARKGIAPKAELCPITATKPLELVHLDYLQLEPSKGNIENVLVITDHYTRYAQAYPSKTQTAQATAKLLWDNFIVHYGFPEKFFSDQGRNFVSELIQDLCRIAKVKKINTTPYHPMSNGQCERFNKTLCNMLGTLSEEEKLDWKSHISSMTHAYNCTKNASTGFSPYFLMYGRQPRLPIDVKFGLFRNLSSSTFSKSKYIDRLKKRLDFAYQKANAAQQKDSARHKLRYDKKAQNITLYPGDLVLVRVVAFKGKHKIQNRWEDEEYVIVSQPNLDIPVYKVKPVTGQGRERTLHRNLLLPLGTSISEEEQSDSDSEEIEVVVPQKIVGPDSKSDQSEVSVKKDSLQDESVELSKSSSNLFGSDSKDFEGLPLTSMTDIEDTTLESKPTIETEIDSVNDSKMNYRDTQKNDTDDIELSQFFEELESHQSSQNQVNKTDDSLTQLLTDMDKLSLDSPKTKEEDQDNSQVEEKKTDPKVESQTSESESEEEIPTPQVVRRSSRSTKGAPPQRFGYAYTHKIGMPLKSHSKGKPLSKILSKTVSGRGPKPILKDAGYPQAYDLLRLFKLCGYICDLLHIRG